MNRLLLIVLLAMFLSACGTQPVRDDSPESDLQTLKANVERETKHRTLPNGKEYCFEDSATEDDQDECTGDLEDTLYAANRALDRVNVLVQKAVQRLTLARNPCGRIKAFFNRSQCNVD